MRLEIRSDKKFEKNFGTKQGLKSTDILVTNAARYSRFGLITIGRSSSKIKSLDMKNCLADKPW